MYYMYYMYSMYSISLLYIYCTRHCVYVTTNYSSLIEDIRYLLWCMFTPNATRAHSSADKLFAYYIK